MAIANCLCNLTRLMAQPPLAHAGIYSLSELRCGLFKRGNTIVPLKQGRCWAHSGNRILIEFPNRVYHRMIVGIQDVFLELGMAGDMDLRNSLGATLFRYS